MDEPTFLEEPSDVSSSVIDESSTSQEQGGHLAASCELIERLDCAELTALRSHFYERRADDRVKEPKGSAHPRFCGAKLTCQQFVDAVQQVLETSIYSKAAESLFEHMVERSANEHKKFVWWEQVLDAIIEWTLSQNRERPWEVVKECLCRLFTISHCKRETIVRVVPIETPSSFCYVLVSKYGRVGIYDWNMNLLEQYEIRLGAQMGDGRRTTWVTDAVYLPDASMLLISASDRSLHVFCTTGLVHVPTYHISGLANTPTCLHYSVGQTTEDPSMLLIGDDHGSITTMLFSQPQYSLFKRTSSDRMDTYFWKELESQRDWVTSSVASAVHGDEVIKVEFFGDNNTVVSCSSDPQATLVIRYLAGRRAPYVFRISRGVRCFHLDRSLKLLATGSKDCVVRMWNPVIARKPIASLFAHKACVVDLRILKHLHVIISISKDSVLKVWDITEQRCLQSLPMLFPLYGALARTPEFGAQALYPGPVACAPPRPETDSRRAPSLPAALAAHPASLLSSSTTARLDRASAFNNGESKDHVTWRASSASASVESSASLGLLESGRTATQLTSQTGTVLQSSSGSTPLISCTDAEWSRSEMLVVCCNYVVLLQLSGRPLGDAAGRVGEALPPPLREQDPAVPSPWLTADSAPASLLTVDYPSQSQLSSGGQSGGPPSPSPLPYNAAVLETIQRGLGDELTYQFKALTSDCHNLNAARARQYTAQKHVRAMVEQCAPHLALSLCPLEEIQLSQGLPVTARLRPLGDLSSPDKLLKARLKRDSTSTVASRASHSQLSSSTASRNK